MASDRAQGLRRLVHDLGAVRRHADRATANRYVLAVCAALPRIARTKSLVPADEAMAGRTCRFTPLPGRSVVLDGSSFSSARELYCRRVYFIRPGFEIGTRDVVVDLGANAGLFSTMAAVYGSLVIAVEAQSGFFPLMEANLARNGCAERARLVHALVGAGTGILSDEAARAAATHWGEQPVERSIADIIAMHELDHVDLLKVDIEGSEFDAFSGDLSWSTVVRRIVMEVHTAFGDVGALRARLAAAGFDTVLVDDATARPVAEITAPSGYLFAERRDPRPSPAP